MHVQYGIAIVCVCRGAVACLVVGDGSCNTVILVDVEAVLRIVFGFVIVYFSLDVAVFLRILVVVVCFFICLLLQDFSLDMGICRFCLAHLFTTFAFEKAVGLSFMANPSPEVMGGICSSRK